MTSEKALLNKRSFFVEVGMLNTDVNKAIKEKVFNSVPCDNWRLSHASRGEWKRKDASCGHEDCHPISLETGYCTSINAALQAVERMRMNCWPELELSVEIRTGLRGWIVKMATLNEICEAQRSSHANDKSMAMAICLAAIKML